MENLCVERGKNVFKRKGKNFFFTFQFCVNLIISNKFRKLMNLYFNTSTISINTNLELKLKFDADL